MHDNAIALTLADLADVGLSIEKHTNYDNAYFCNGEGPFPSPKAAVLAGIRRLANDAKALTDLASTAAPPPDVPRNSE